MKNLNRWNYETEVTASELSVTYGHFLRFAITWQLHFLSLFDKVCKNTSKSSNEIDFNKDSNIKILRQSLKFKRPHYSFLCGSQFEKNAPVEWI